MKKLVAFFLLGFFLSANALSIDWLKYNEKNDRLIAQITNDSNMVIDDFSVEFFADGNLFDTFTREGLSLYPKSTIEVFGEFVFDGQNHEFKSIAVENNLQSKESIKTEKTIFFEFKKNPKISQPNFYIILLAMIVCFIGTIVVGLLVKKKLVKRE